MGGEKLDKQNIALALAAIALLISGGIFLTSSKASSFTPTERTIYMIAFEPKGSTTIDKEPFPTEPLPGGGGYALKDPDETGKWTVETYRWNPSIVVVNQGDQVTLEILGVNGKEHNSFIEEYVDNFVITRGKITKVSFTADKAGTFKIVCRNHQPAMTGYLVVNPIV